MIRSVLKNANLVLAFLLELCVLLALGYWGFVTGPTMLAKIGLGIGLPILAIVIWAILGAPRSAQRLRGGWYWLLRVVFYGLSAVFFYADDQHTLGIVFAFIVLLNSVLGYAWKQE
jgi:hypothetical protein